MEGSDRREWMAKVIDVKVIQRGKRDASLRETKREDAGGPRYERAFWQDLADSALRLGLGRGTGPSSASCPFRLRYLLRYIVP